MESEFIQFENDSLMYKELAKYFDLGYKIVNTYGLGVEISNGENSFILSYTPVDKSGDIKSQLEEAVPKHEVWMPDYNDTFLNVLASIRENFGFKSDYKPIEGIFDKKYKKVIILLLDGMGVNIMNKHLPNTSKIRANYLRSIHAIYPSTTAAATTSIRCGIAPITSGWTGWENYFSEVKRNVILFTGKDNLTGDQTEVSGYKCMPYQMFYHDMDGVNGYSVEPDFSKKESDISDVLNRSLQLNLRDEKQVQYVYYSEPDGLMHETGPYASEVTHELKGINERVEEYLKKLTPDTLVIITADHGHIGVKPIHLFENPLILNLLERNPSNDARSVTFKVKNGKNKEFEAIFNGLYKNVYKLFSKDEVIESKMIGDPKFGIHPRIDDFIGDYMGCAISEYYFQYKEYGNFDFKSHHAGITKEEMEVPICVIRK